MKRISLTAIGVLVVLTTCFVYFSYFSTSSAQKFARNQWEYCSINSVYSFSPVKDKLNRIYGMVEICYLQPNGCKRAEVKQELDYGEFLQERGISENFNSRKEASIKASEIAFQKAMSQLGNEGWEIVSEPDIKYQFVDIDDYNKFENKSYLFVREDTKAIYFKRLK
jgi:hypothetical protein